MNLRAFVPNSITSANLLCGVLSILMATQGELEYAAYFIFGGAFLDFWDGFAARALKVNGDFGKQLDSLADVITFGAAPGFIAYSMIGNCTECQLLYFSPPTLAYIGLLLPVFSALRLARFNIDTRQTTYFLGVPTPAMGIFFASLAFLPAAFPELADRLMNTRPMVVLTLLFCYLMVSEHPMISLKFKHYGFKGNETKWILLVLSLPLLIWLKWAGIAPIILLYLILSLFNAKAITENS